MEHPDKFNGEQNDIIILYRSLLFLKAQWVMANIDGWSYKEDLERKISSVEDRINKKKYKHEFK